MEAVESRRVASAFRRLLVIDVVVTLPVLGAWIDNELTPTPLVLVLALLRLSATFAYLWQLLAPVRQWQNSAAPDDAALLAADDAIQTLFQRVCVAQVVGWTLTLGLPLALVLRAPVPELLPGQRLFALALIGVAVVFNPTIMFAYFRQLCDAFTAELGPQLAARELVPPRTRRSYARELVLLGMALTFSTMLSAGSSAFNIDSQRLHAEIRGEQREQLQQLGHQLSKGISFEHTELRAEQLSSDELPAVLAQLLDSTPAQAPEATLVSIYDSEHEQMLSAYALGDGRWLSLSDSLVHEGREGVITFAVYILVVMGLVGLAMYWLAQALTGPLSRLEQATRRMAEDGELESIGLLTPARDDELGTLVRNFNDMLTMLRELVGAARAVADGDLSVEVTHPGELHDAFRGMVTQLREMVERLRTTAVEVTSATSEIHTSMEHQAQLAERHAKEVEQANETIYSLADAAQNIDQLSAQVLRHAETNLQTIDHMVAKIEQLGGQASGIGELLDQIREVAARSDLLALNGSLEATRAGEAGRGFALVAAEIRRLAERITGVVADVRERIADIDQAGSETVAATDQGRSLANDTAQVARQISELSQAQSADSRRASITASAMADFVLSAALGMTQTRTAADGLRSRVAELERLTKSLRL